MLTGMRDPRSIVVAQLSFIGDMVFTTPLLSGLRDLWPGALITVVGRPAVLGVLDGFPGVGGTIPYDKDDEERAPGSILAIGRRIRALAPELFLGVTRSPRTALLARLSGAPVRAGFRGALRRLAYTHTVERNDAGTPLPERPLALLRAVGHPIAPRRLTLSVSADRRSRAVAALQEAGWKGEPIVAVVPGSNYATKRWPERHVARLLDLVLAARPWRPALYGGPAEKDLIDRLLAGRPAVLDRRGTTVSTLRDELSLVSAVLAGDSGPAHIARALGTPVAALFGPTSPALVRDQAPYREITLGIECQPCSPHGDAVCPLGHHRCLEEVTPETVLGVLDDLLRS
jgi:heptosyltransferase-2